MSYKTIVAVLSAAEDAGKVTDHALALARRTGGHVVGIHAESPVVVTLIALAPGNVVPVASPV